METQVEKMLECEFAQVDKTSAPCHNPPTFIDRKGGHVVCIAHADGLEVFLAHQRECAQAEHDAQALRKFNVNKTGGLPMFPSGSHGISPGVK